MTEVYSLLQRSDIQKEKEMTATYTAIHFNENRLATDPNDRDVLTESEMWTVIERDVGALPLYLKNILSINGFNHLLSLEELDETSIQEVEKFAREHMRDYVPLTSAYFYIFQKNPEDFRIVSGHRKLLLKLRDRIRQNGVQYYTQLKVPVVKMSDFFNDDDSQNTPMSILKPLDHSMDTSMNNSLPPPPLVTLTPIEPEHQVKRRRRTGAMPDIYTEEEKIRILVYNWYRKYAVGDLDISTISAAVCDSDDKSYGVVACPLCAVDVKIGAERNKNGSHRWIISNYVKHFQKHHQTSFKRETGYKIEIC